MNDENKKRQKLLIYAVAVVALLISISTLMLFTFFDGKKPPKKIYASSAELPLDNIDPKEIWVDQIKTENELVQGKVDYIQEMVVGRIKEEEARDNANQKEILSLRDEIKSLRGELVRQSTNSIDINLQADLRNVSGNQGSWDPFSNMPPPPPLEIFSPLSCVICPEPQNLYHVNRTIPTGTTVKAILLSSVDIPCGVGGPTDPLPVKLRVIADGRLPHNVKARLKGGIITACVYGDLSSERAYFRLEKLTQVRPDGHYIETQVAGYVSGEDGKYGMRGTVVDKSCQLIENALVSGFLSGASEFFETVALSRLYPYPPAAPLVGNFVPSWGQTATQLGIAGGTQGATNALDALTDYFIKRAEQLRPVIEITPGRIVDITFSDCADLGDLHTHERVRSSGDGGFHG